jgi:hypothetical protein
MLRGAGVKQGMWCLAFEMRIRPEVPTSLLFRRLTDTLLAQQLVVILQEKGRLVAELRERPLRGQTSGMCLVHIQNTKVL